MEANYGRSTKHLGTNFLVTQMLVSAHIERPRATQKAKIQNNSHIERQRATQKAKMIQKKSLIERHKVTQKGKMTESFTYKKAQSFSERKNNVQEIYILKDMELNRKQK